MTNISQLIKSSAGDKSEARGQWHVNDSVKPFIMGIETGDFLDDIDAEVFNSLISGVPTPWARAKMFWYAFQYLHSTDPNIKQSGLVEKIFPQLIDEWKGMIAIIALFPDRVKFSEPISLDCSSIRISKSINDLSSSFGRMLFEDSDLWSEQIELINEPDTKPFIQLVYYKDQLIGATSPFSIVFPGIDYSKLSGASDIKWYKKGRFENPTQYFKEDQRQKVYSFLFNLFENINGFEEELNIARKGKQDLNLKGFKASLRSWRDEINWDKNLKDNIPPAKYYNLNSPFKTLLASEQAVYIIYKDGGAMTFKKPEKGEEGKNYEVLSDLQNFLLDSDTLLGWFESTDEYQPLSESAVHYLTVKNTLSDVKGEYLYFALPLSQAGINSFKPKINSLLACSDSNKLEAYMNGNDSLQVELTVTVDKQPIKLNTKEYKIEWEMGNKPVILWPNFTSDNWNAYFLYSEFPENTTDKKFIPFFKQTKEFKDSLKGYTKSGGIIEYQRNSFVLSTSTSKEKSRVGLDVETIIKYPHGKVNEEVPVYEILKSNKPIAGLSIEFDDKKCGYLLLKEGGDYGLEDFSNNDNALETATVSIDFGSNNSCAYFSLNTNSEVKPIKFSNRRVALVGVDLKKETVAHDSELLFFQNAEGYKGQIKSWLHEHDPLAPVNKDSDDELQGGVPVNEKNIHIKRMDKYKITTQAGVLHYNMKWLSDTSGVLKKTAFLKTIWLQICADLYGDRNERCIPSNIKWSYPGAMSQTDMTQYAMIFSKSLPKLSPILDSNSEVIKPLTDAPKTESEAVCGYALSNEAGSLTNSNVFLGIDIGGSTSDILVLAKVKENKKIINKLIKQSSVRLAAGVFFDAIIKSNRFKEELYNFHDNKGRQLKLNVISIGDLKDPQKKDSAPFYLNSIFDQLQDDGFEEFYQYMGTRSKFVFAIPSFVTGLLLYYAGMLVSNAIKAENLEGIKKVDLFGFGKGGRLFHWLDTYPGDFKTKPYLENCFRRGYGEDAVDITLNIRSDIRPDNKSEVAMGLVSSNSPVVDESLRNTSDIFGEKGIRLYVEGEDKEFDADEIIHSEYFTDPGAFTFSEEPENFNEFLDLFLDFVGPQTEIVKNTNTLKMKSVNMKELLTAYLSNDPEWLKANKRKNNADGVFEYRFPIIIAEGLCFLEKILIPEVFNV